MQTSERKVMPSDSTKSTNAYDSVAEWSKALRSGRSLFGGVGSNPTLTILFMCGSIFRSIEVSIPACHAGDPGSIPGGRDFWRAHATVV